MSFARNKTGYLDKTQITNLEFFSMDLNSIIRIVNNFSLGESSKLEEN